MPDPRDTPAMRQYYRFKRLHPECLLFFRIGDFYEMFDDDAVRASKALGLTLTQRTEGVPMAGVPYHQIETYLRRCVEQGMRVAVCEQLQDPSEVKAGSVIERSVTRVLTPGTLVDDTLLASDTPSLLGSVCFTEAGDDSPAAIAVVDLSTGRFDVFECAASNLTDELVRRGVTELLYADTADSKPPPRVKRVLDSLNLSGTPQPAWHFRIDEAREAITVLFGVSTLAGFGLADDEAVVRPAGAIVRYLQFTQLPSDTPAASGSAAGAQPPRSLKHIRPPRRDEGAGFLTLDATTLRSLEVLRTIRAGGPGSSEADGSLLGVFAPSRTFPGCRTAMGKRLLREWLCRPLADGVRISARQHCVSTLIEDRTAAGALTAALDNVQDIGRIAGRLALGRATPRDLVALGRSLGQIRPVAEAITNAPAFTEHLRRIAALADGLAPLADRIAVTCVDAPPAHLREGGLIRDGVDAELDEARLLQRDGATWMSEYQARLAAEHSLPSLRVGFNKVFGYYIELPAAQAKRAPDVFTRKQTLKSAERYITPELKAFEEKVTTAETRGLTREQAMFDDLCGTAGALIPSISSFADACAELDVLACFAEKASRRQWKRPEIEDESVLIVHQGRHPVLDELLGSNFVPNDLELGAGEGGRRAALALITGPNMAGKSTYIRTAALLTLLAHTGSFVPVDRMTLGLTDRIFTRIGADDALHAGQSTFMVEMTETARILNHATGRSLIVLDEIGRGTSTLDGLSLAWAIAESLASPDGGPGERKGACPRTLFATHYHELTDLEELLPGQVMNLHVSVREWGDDIVFLHRILPGKTDQSYGIHVAKLAGIPAATISRARQILESLAVHHALGEPGASATSRGTKNSGKAAIPPHASGQLSLFTEYVPHPAIDKLREIKLDGLTPLEAFDVLRRLKVLTDQATSPAS